MEDSIKPLSDIPAINRFLSYCRIRTVPSKTVIIHAGDLPDVLYYIISGSVEVMIEDEEGNEMVLAYLNKGQFFGEMGLFHDQPTRSAWVRTRNQCELAEMTYPRFRQIAAESPGLVFELATQLATRLDRTNRKLGDLAFVDVTGRVAHAIMDPCGACWNRPPARKPTIWPGASSAWPSCTTGPAGCTHSGTRGRLPLASSPASPPTA
jgi:CRP/FNR family cyclic AMP-dependent transcriptional regulator